MRSESFRGQLRIRALRHFPLSTTPVPRSDVLSQDDAVPIISSGGVAYTRQRYVTGWHRRGTSQVRRKSENTRTIIMVFQRTKVQDFIAGWVGRSAVEFHLLYLGVGVSCRRLSQRQGPSSERGRELSAHRKKPSARAEPTEKAERSMHPADNLSSPRQKETTTTKMTMERERERRLRREKEEGTLQKLSYAHSPTATPPPNQPTNSDLRGDLPKSNLGFETR